MTSKDLSSLTPIVELKDFENNCLMGVLCEEWRSMGLGVGVQSGQPKELVPARKVGGSNGGTRMLPTWAGGSGQ